jgi:hypothetical protein
MKIMSSSVYPHVFRVSGRNVRTIFRTCLDNTYFDGQTNMYWMRRELKWIFEYILSCHPDPKTFVARVGTGISIILIWDAETMNVDRPVYKLTDKSPGPDLTASAAGTMALCSMIFTDIDNSLASRCLQASKTIPRHS